MGWKETSPVPAQALPAEQLLKKETHWTCSYNEPERWIKDFKEVYYTLIGTYEVDENHTLYRFELDETKRSLLHPNAYHFHTVLVDKRIKPVQLGNTFK